MSILVVGHGLSVRTGMSIWGSSGVFAWVYFPFFCLPEKLVQVSAILWAQLPLGPTYLIVTGSVLSVGYVVSVWVLNGGVAFFWAWYFSRGGSGYLLEYLVQGSSLL